jgi:hypothetical protein
LVTARHSTDEHAWVWAEVAREAYVPYLAADSAFVHSAPFYEAEYFREVYQAAEAATDRFTRASTERLADVLTADPRVLLVLRTVIGLTKEEFAHSTMLVAQSDNRPALSASKIDAMERRGLRFERLREEARRLGGIPVLAVLGGMGWARVNDTLGPVIRDTEGRVFTKATLPQILDLAPFPRLRGLA